MTNDVNEPTNTETGNRRRMLEKPKTHTELLMLAFRYDEVDLEANRKGELSDRQRNSIERTAKRDLMISRFLWWGGTLLTVLVFCQMLDMGFLIPGLGFAAFGLITSLDNRHRVRDARKLTVAIVEGRVYQIMSSTSNTGLRLAVESIVFDVPKPIFLLFKNGDPYRIHYLPHTRIILSAEWLREDDPFEEPEMRRS